jgi:hypothetical protein
MMNLILLYMFIAIFDSYYLEIKNSSIKDDKNLF